jgi:hypothetical protein
MSHEDTTAHLAGGLPPYFPASKESGNYKLLDSVAGELDKHEQDIEDVDISTSVQDAETIDELSELGKLVNTPPNENETLSHYRARLIAEFAINTCEGTIKDVLETAAEIFDADVESFRYAEPSGSEYGTIELGVPGRALDNTALTDSEAAEILERLIAASYRLDGFRVGTFTYITPTDYNNNNFDATKGYDGLDANGDPKDNGGTYAGLLR